MGVIGVAARFRLAEYIDKAGISQAELHRLSGVSPTAINRMCANTMIQVSLKTLDSLAVALEAKLGEGVQPGDLIVRIPPRESAA